MNTEFSVYQFFIDGSQETVHRFITARQAIMTVKGLMESIGGRIGTTQRIIITDGGDYIVWEWQFGKGIVFDAKEKEI